MQQRIWSHVPTIRKIVCIARSAFFLFSSYITSPRDIMFSYTFLHTYTYAIIWRLILFLIKFLVCTRQKFPWLRMAMNFYLLLSHISYIIYRLRDITQGSHFGTMLLFFIFFYFDITTYGIWGFKLKMKSC